MRQSAVKALRERLQSDEGFKEYVEHAESGLTRQMNGVVDGAPGSVSNDTIRELMGQLRMIRHLRRELLES